MLIFLLLFFPFYLVAQSTNRTLTEMKGDVYLEWESIKTWADSAKNTIDLLPADSARGKEAFDQLHKLRKSALGAVVLNTGGILVDNGWIRVIASGHECLNRSLSAWNKYFFEDRETPGYMVIGDDAIGGYFLLNNDDLGGEIGAVYYFSPASLEYEPMAPSYTDFLQFCFSGDLNKFYKGYRWKSWYGDIPALPTDKVYNFSPPLWTKAGRDLEKTLRTQVPVKEQFMFHIDMRKKIGLDKTETIGHE